MRIALALITAAVFALGAGWLLWLAPSEPVADTQPGAPMVAVSLPSSFTDREQMGQTAFAANCAACHGENGWVAPKWVRRLFTRSMNQAITPTYPLNAPSNTVFDHTIGISAIWPPLTG